MTEVYLNGLCYKDLKITFKDGMVDDYECANFPDKEDGRKFIKENLLYNRETHRWESVRLERIQQPM